MLRKLVAVVAAVVVAASFAVASAMASEKPSRISVAKRIKGTSPPPLVTTPTAPEAPPRDRPDVAPDDHGPVDFAPPPAAPPLPAAPEVPAPPVSPGPTPPSPADNVGPAETVRPPLGRPDDAPVRLPQTGSGTRPLTATGGASLLAAGLAMIAGARQSARVRQPVRRR